MESKSEPIRSGTFFCKGQKITLKRDGTWIADGIEITHDQTRELFYRAIDFDPQTKARATDRPRILINDGFGTHESLEIMKYCWENNIILHTSHKLQPCDVGAFSPLKQYYRE